MSTSDLQKKKIDFHLSNIPANLKKWVHGLTRLKAHRHLLERSKMVGRLQAV